MKEQKSTPNLALYTTLGCHLCEQAEALIFAAVGATVRPVEITDDVELLERYAIRIPVLRRGDTGEELDWPFDTAAVRRLLHNEKRGVNPI
ncbi:MAG: glutaredoxin family protein [Candidatus Contendobacter sp.]|nr:glutaredoxin family protein [Candidatus Contendobacter sp.]